MLLWLHISLRKHIYESNGKVIFCGAYVTYYYVCTIQQFDFATYVVPAIFIFLWIKLQFKEKIVKTLLRYCISMIGLGISQLVSIWLMDVVFSNIYMTKTAIYIAGCALSLLFSVLVYFFAINRRMKIIKFDVYMLLFFSYVILLMVYLKYYYEYHEGLYGGLYIALITVLFVVIVVAIKGLKTEYKLNKKQLELDMREKYESVYNLLLLEMRRKQHDYKNQITALYSIHMLEDNNERVAKLEKECGDRLLKDTKFDNLILHCDNPVLSGYIYTQCNLAMRKGINVVPTITCANKNYCISIHEIIEIMGILINNAIEYLADKDWLIKEIKIDIHDELDKLYIAVENVTEYIAYEMIEKMFDVRYSTKGYDRGVGLYSLKNIVHKNKGELSVENCLDEKGNWFRIKIIV